MDSHTYSTDFIIDVAQVIVRAQQQIQEDAKKLNVFANQAQLGCNLKCPYISYNNFTRSVRLSQTWKLTTTRMAMRLVSCQGGSVYRFNALSTWLKLSTRLDKHANAEVQENEIERAEIFYQKRHKDFSQPIVHLSGAP
jgi:hypothetical protein